jgi:hypothetical protein
MTMPAPSVPSAPDRRDDPTAMLPWVDACASVQAPRSARRHAEPVPADPGMLAERARRWQIAGVALLSALCVPGAFAAAEPTPDAVARKARAGHVEQALPITPPLLQAHPDSAESRYAQAERLAREGRLQAARLALAEAERLAPGLPFAPAEAVRRLHQALDAAAAGSAPPFDTVTPQAAGSRHGMPPWSAVAAGCGGALLAWALMRLGRPAATADGGCGDACPDNTAAGAGPGGQDCGRADATSRDAPATRDAAGGLGDRVA